MCEGEVDGPEATHRARRLPLGAARQRRDARSGRGVRERGAAACDGRQGVRAGGERGVAAGHRRRVLRDARRALGLRFSDRRRGGVRRRRGRRGVGRRRGLRRVVRRALPAHGAAPRAGDGAADAPGRCALQAHPRGAGQHRRDPPELARDARHADRRREMGGRARLGLGGRSRAHRGARPDAARQAGRRIRSGEAAPARRDGDAGQRQPLPRSAGGHRTVRRERRADFRAGARRRGRDDPLRFARPGAPDRHRLPEPHGRGSAAPWPDPSRSRTRLRADPQRPRPAVPRCDARRDQLRAGEPADHHAPGARGVSRAVAAGEAGAALRRVAQHLQGRDACRRWPRARALRASQGRDARLRPRPPGLAEGTAHRPASRC